VTSLLASPVGTGIWLAIAIIAIGLGPITWEAATGRGDVFNLKNPFIVYYVIQLAVSGIVTLSTGRASVIGLDPATHPAAYQRALLLSAAGLLCFQIGYYAQRSLPWRVPGLLRQPWDPGRVRLVVATFLFTGLVTFVLFLRHNGGLANFLAAREEFRAGGMSGQGALIFPSTSMAAFAALALLALDAQSRSRRRLALLVFCVVLVPPFVMGFRGLFGLPILQLMVVWNAAVRRLKAGAILVLLSLLAVLFTVYGVMRTLPPGLNSSQSMLLARTAIDQNPELLYSVVSRSKGTEVVASEMERLRKSQAYEYGWRGALEAATILIPSGIWHGKPIPSIVRFTTYFFGEDLSAARGVDRESWGGISPTAVGELYWHFGWIGVLLGMFLLGHLAKIVYVSYLHHRRWPGIQVAYAIFYTSFAMFAETFQGYVNGLVMLAVVGGAAFAFMRRSRHPMSIAPRSGAR
jgi:hypothetical protein